MSSFNYGACRRYRWWVFISGFAVAVAVSGIFPFMQGEAAAQTGTQTLNIELPLLEEIIVTATKRSRSIQDVPIAVSALSDVQLKNAGVRDIRELMSVAPSLFLSSSQSESAGAVARIRGVGTTGDNAGLESAVGVFIDGVYRNRNNVGLSELGEIERIEVLRGPQGTLFGRNTSAGLINIVTKAPGYDPSGYAEVGYGKFDEMRVAGGVSGGLDADSMAVRLDAVYTQRNGFLEDAVTGEDYNTRDRGLVRGQLLFEGEDSFSARLIVDYADRDENCCAAVTLVPGPTLGLIQALGGTLLGDPFDRKAAADPDIGYDSNVKEAGVSAELNWDLEIGTVTSITAYRDWEVKRSQDIDYTNADILYRPKDGFVQGFETFTQELRLQGEAGSIDWLVGAFYSNEDLSLQDAIRVGANYEQFINGLITQNPFSGFYSAFTGLAPGSVFVKGEGAVRDNFVQKSESLAIFTHNTVAVSDDFEITGGLRYTEETKDVEASLQSNNRACTPGFAGAVSGAAAFGLLPPAQVPTIIGLVCLPFFNPFVDGNYDGSHKETELSGTAKLAYSVSDDDLVYASYARGYKGGGYNLDRAGLSNPLSGGRPSAADLEFDAEIVDSFELGGKFGLGGGRATLNAALFYMDFKDFQLNTFTGVNFLVNNLEKVKSTGLELESMVAATENLTLQAGVTYADTKYGSKVSNATLAGQNITNAPEWTVTGAATFEQDLTNSLSGFFHVDFRYMSEYNTGSDLDIEKIQEGFGVVNGRIGVGDIDGAWRIELWAKNLFDKDYIQIAFDAPLQGTGTGPGSTQQFNAFLAEPQTFGLTLRGQF